MSSQSSAIVQRLWNYCTVLRDDGLSYGDYVEQLTYLLFLKMDDERRKIGDPSTIPDGYAWASLVNLDGSELESCQPGGHGGWRLRNIVCETVGGERPFV